MNEWCAGNVDTQLKIILHSKEYFYPSIYSASTNLRLELIEPSARGGLGYLSLTLFGVSLGLSHVLFSSFADTAL